MGPNTVVQLLATKRDLSCGRGQIGVRISISRSEPLPQTTHESLEVEEERMKGGD